MYIHMRIDLAKRKAKEMARSDCVPVDSNDLLNSLSPEVEMVKEHLLRLKKVR